MTVGDAEAAAAPHGGGRYGAVAFLRYLLRAGGARGFLAIAMQILSLLTEGVSLLLLIPLLNIIARSDSGISLTVPKSWATDVMGLGGAELSLSSVLAIFVVLIAFAAGLNRYQLVLSVDVLNAIVNRTRLDLLHAIASARWAYVGRRRPSDLSHLLIGEVDRLNLAAATVFNTIRIAVSLVVYAALSLYVSPAMSLAAAVLGVTTLALMRPIRRGADRLGRRIARHRQEQYRTAGDFLAGLSVVKALNAEDRSVNHLTTMLIEMRHDARAFARLSGTASMLFQILNAAGAALFVWFALVFADMDLATLVVLLLVFMRAAPRVILLQQLAEQLLVNLPAFDALQEAVRDLEAAAEPVGVGRPPLRLSRAVACEAVGYRYFGAGKESPALSDVTLSFAVGEVTVLIGPSGSGKSTLGSLLIGLIAPTSGQITIDGEILCADQLRLWRDQVGFVPQETFLVHDTIAVNLRLALRDAPETELWEALDQAQARAFVEALPQRLETVVGDRGGRLSGGERQRIALARALLRRPRLLVLDEATSALDIENERLIAASIQDLKRDMAIVTIAHRPAMIEIADTIVTLRDGRVVEVRPGRARSPG